MRCRVSTDYETASTSGCGVFVLHKYEFAFTDRFIQLDTGTNEKSANGLRLRK